LDLPSRSTDHVFDSQYALSDRISLSGTKRILKKTAHEHVDFLGDPPFFESGIAFGYPHAAVIDYDFIRTGLFVFDMRDPGS